MPDIFVYEKIVNFYETDAAGLVHFSNYFRYLEEAEAALLEKLGFELYSKKSTVVWQRNDISCEFLGPIKFNDIVRILLHIKNIDQNLISYSFRFVVKQTEVATGKYTARKISICPQNRTIEPIPIGNELYAAISVA